MADPQNSETSPHLSVMPTEVVEALAPHSDGIYVDGTMGAGGHSALILKASAPKGSLIAIDRDPLAHKIASEKIGDSWKRVRPVHGCFGDIAEHLDHLGIDRVDGMLLDLGVSSMQLDRRERGFSFSKEGPIDMRMNPESGQSALELIQTSSEEGLARILWEYGEERFSRRIAKRIQQDAAEDKLHTTLDLADSIAACIPGKLKQKSKIHPATRSFQALRIAVNKELDEVEKFLKSFPARLKKGGRCAIISFHSLEDRLVKRAFRELAQSSSLPPDLARRAGERVEPICKLITRKPLIASESETSTNPRARSAKLRVCEKVAE